MKKLLFTFLMVGALPLFAANPNPPLIASPLGRALIRDTTAEQMRTRIGAGTGSGSGTNSGTVVWNVRDFGAVGNNLALDSLGFKLAVSNLCRYGGVVYMPRTTQGGEYILTNQFILPPLSTNATAGSYQNLDMSFVGDGISATRIKLALTNGTFIKANQGFPNLTGFSITDVGSGSNCVLWSDYAGGPSVMRQVGLYNFTNSIPVNLQAADFSRFEDVDTAFCFAGIRLRRYMDNSYVRIYARHMGAAGVVIGGTSTNYPGGDRPNNCLIDYQGNYSPYGVIVGSGEGVEVRGYAEQLTRGGVSFGYPTDLFPLETNADIAVGTVRNFCFGANATTVPVVDVIQPVLKLLVENSFGPIIVGSTNVLFYTCQITLNNNAPSVSEVRFPFTSKDLPVMTNPRMHILLNSGLQFYGADGATTNLGAQINQYGVSAQLFTGNGSGLTNLGAVNVWNVRDFGAVGNNLALDSLGFKLAVSNLCRYGGVVYMPRTTQGGGEYILTNQFILPPLSTNATAGAYQNLDMSFVGDGISATRIKLALTNGTFIKANKGFPNLTGFSITDVGSGSNCVLWSDYAGGPSVMRQVGLYNFTNSIPVNLQAADFSRFEDLDTAFCFAGIRLRRYMDNCYVRIYARNMGAAGVVVGGLSTNFPGSDIAHNCLIDYQGNYSPYGVIVGSGEGVEVRGFAEQLSRGAVCFGYPTDLFPLETNATHGVGTVRNFRIGSNAGTVPVVDVIALVSKLSVENCMGPLIIASTNTSFYECQINLKNNAPSVAEVRFPFASKDLPVMTNPRMDIFLNSGLQFYGATGAETNLGAQITQYGVTAQLFTGPGSGLTTLAGTNVVWYPATFPSATNTLTLNNGDVTLIVGTDVAITNLAGVTSGQSKWATLSISNSAATQITARMLVGATVRAQGTATVAALLIGAAKTASFTFKVGTWSNYWNTVEP